MSKQELQSIKLFSMLHHILLLLLIISLSSCYGPINNLTPINSVQGRNFIVMGDCRYGNDIFSDIVNIISILDNSPEAIFILGDMISDPGNLFQWSVFSQTSQPLKLAGSLYPIVGNHDVNNMESRLIYLNQFNMENTYYSVKDDEILFIILDSEEPGNIGFIGPEQLDFLVDQLENTPEDIYYLIILLHRPLFQAGTHAPLENYEELHSIFVTYNVDIVFASHDHMFDFREVEGVSYIISGGAGAPLYPEIENSFYHFIRFYIWEHSLYFQVISPSGDVIKEFEISQKRNNQNEDQDFF